MVYNNLYFFKRTFYFLQRGLMAYFSSSFFIVLLHQRRQLPEWVLMSWVSQLCADSTQAERNCTPPSLSPPVFTCLLFVIIAPLVLLSRALVRFFPVPLGQSEGHKSSYSPLILIPLISTRMKNKQGMSILHKLWLILGGDAVRRSDTEPNKTKIKYKQETKIYLKKTTQKPD